MAVKARRTGTIEPPRLLQTARRRPGRENSVTPSPFRNPPRSGRRLTTVLRPLLPLVLFLLPACAPGGPRAGIQEGPIVQLPRPTGVTLVWFADGEERMEVMVKAAPGSEGGAAVSGSGDRRLVEASPGPGGRYRVRIEGLTPGRTYRYRIQAGGEGLFRGEFRTDPAGDVPFRFAVLGDSGSGWEAQREVAARIRAARPDFLLHTGDLVYPEGTRSDYLEKFFRPYRDLLSRVALWPCLGNHDDHAPGYGKAFREIFALPGNGPEGPGTEADYWFDHGRARFVVVNTEHRMKELREVIAPWLVRTLADPGIRWRIVAFHRPPFASSAEPYTAKRVRKALVPALEQARADVVFMGHKHFYERSRPLRGGKIVKEGEGVVYVISGGGGGDLQDLLPASERAPWSAAAFGDDSSFTLVTVGAKSLRLRQISRTGETVDDYTLSR